MLQNIARTVIDRLSDELEENPGLDLEDRLTDIVNEEVSDRITTDATALEAAKEIDLDDDFEGDTLFRRIQSGADWRVRQLVEMHIADNPDTWAKQCERKG